VGGGRRRESSRGVGPADPQGVGNGSPVRRPLARRPGTSGRAPGRHRRPSRYCDAPCRHPPASRAPCPRSSDRRTVALARSATAFRSGGARIQHRPLRGWLGPSQPGPSWRSSVGHWPNTSPERGPGVTSPFAHRPVVFGPRASAASEAAASPESPDSVVRRRSSRTPGRWRMPSRALGGRQPLLGRSKSPSRHPGWKPPTQEWGQFRTVNWTLNAETRLQRERRGPGRRP
jgi:hypothetical protein